MDIDLIKKERLSWLLWKNIAPLREKLDNLCLPPKDVKLIFDEAIVLKSDTIDEEEINKIKDLAQNLKSWRKGPFDIFGLFIDSEWKSNIKYSIIEPFLNIENKKVADIGCNNGYYMFRMLEKKPKKMTGFDPSALFKTQFDFIDFYAKSGISYELLGIEHIPYYQEKFDTILCLGVLYHRSDPILSLKALRGGLEKNGELILDTFMIDGDDEVALCPPQTYSKIPNVYFVPTVKTVKGWLKRAGFKEIEVLGIYETTTKEQRKTDWILGESLGDFLDPQNPQKTVEGYPAPRRIYIKAKG